MKRNYIFIGGGKGVGKSTIIEEVKKRIGLDVVNTGDFFHKYGKDGEKHLIEYLLKHTGMVVDTHYAGHTNGAFDDKYTRGMSGDNLKMLSAQRDLDLILIDTTASSVLQRRFKDLSEKRNLNYQHIKSELQVNRDNFNTYSKELGINGHIVMNDNLYGAILCVTNIINDIKIK